LSIGLDTPLIPPLPGQIDGPKARGLGAHGRVEGDVSMTRQDFAIGDNVNFQPDLFDQLLAIVAQVGDNSTVTGPRSVVNEESLSQFKLLRFKESQANNPEARTDGILSVSTMTSFFRDQRFPENWYRRSTPGTIDVIGITSADIYSEIPVPPGANGPNGTYIEDTDVFGACSSYNAVVSENIPGVLLNTAGILQTNVGFLLNVIHNLFPNCPVAIPQGVTDV
ncbi:hypothetical protein H0H92_016112, partial [Tricholoma furcatifolium]